MTLSAIPSTRPRRIRAAAGVVLRAPWSARSWLATAHVLVGLPVSVAPCLVIVALTGTSAVLLVVPPLLAGVLAALVACTKRATAFQRSRFAAFLGVRIPTMTREPVGDGRLRRLHAEARARSTWRQVGYHVLAPFLGVAGFVVVLASWSVGIALSTAALHGWPHRGIFGWQLRSPVTLAALTAAGLVAFFAAPWLARAAAAVDLALAHALLGPSRSDLLAQRVESLAASRAGAIDAAADERRHIERNLHDGAQQRLTSLAINLGIARQTLTDLPAPASEAIADAHEEAIEALAELRDLVRGLHPAVLDDRGLDAALSGIVARSPVPVRLRVDLPHRPSATIEAIGYFVVSEALTNVAKHARASQIEVAVTRTGTRLALVVTDDGRGGADPLGGTGLRGLIQRVAAVDGTLHIDSPVGGPTTITVELPCES